MECAAAMAANGARHKSDGNRVVFLGRSHEALRRTVTRAGASRLPSTTGIAHPGLRSHPPLSRRMS
jgi:hypothetical protein